MSDLDVYFINHTKNMARAYLELIKESPLTEYYTPEEWAWAKRDALLPALLNSLEEDVRKTLMPENDLWYIPNVLGYYAVVYHDIAKPILYSNYNGCPSFSKRGCTHENLSALLFMVEYQIKSKAPLQRAPTTSQIVALSILATHEIRMSLRKVFCKELPPMPPNRIRISEELLREVGIRNPQLHNAVKFAQKGNLLIQSLDSMAPLKLQALSAPVAAYVVLLDNAEAMISRSHKHDEHHGTLSQVLSYSPLGDTVVKIMRRVVNGH